MNFQITLVEDDGASYRCQIERTVVNKKFEEWTISAGSKVVVMRSNRPKLKNRKTSEWKLVSKNFAVKDVKKASEWLCRLQELIDEKVNPTPSFQQMRNKE